MKSAPLRPTCLTGLLDFFTSMLSRLVAASDELIDNLLEPDH